MNDLLIRKPVFNVLILLSFIFCVDVSSAQSILINNTADGGFENGATFTSNGWNVYNGSAGNNWWLGNITSGSPNHSGFISGTNCAYISNEAAGNTWTYQNSSVSVVSIYRDVTFPAGETHAQLSFNWKALGSTNQDELLVSITSTSNTAVTSNSTIDLGTGIVPGTTLLGRYSQTSGPVNQTVNLTLPFAFLDNCNSAKTWRLVFTWKNNGSGGTNPPIAVDDIHLTSSLPPSSFSGVYKIGSGGSFLNLSAAWTALLTQPITGPVILELLSTYTTEPAYPLNLTPLYHCSNTITIRPNIGVIQTISSSSTVGTITLNGVDNLVIDGRPGGLGTSSGLTITNSSSTGYALKFIDGATYNKIQYCSLQGINTSVNNGVVWFATTTTANGNSYNTIDHCNIKDGTNTPFNGIFSNGSGTGSQRNIGDTISNCNIYNFFNPSGCNGILLSSGNNDWTISGNSFYHTVSRNTTVSSLFHFIQLNNAGEGHHISNNYIGGTAPEAEGIPFTITSTNSSRLAGITVANAGSGIATYIDGNIIKNISFTTANNFSGAPGLWSGIYLNGGMITAGSYEGNVIGSDTGNNSITIGITATTGSGSASYGISGSGSGMILNLRNNKIGSITTQSTASNVQHSLAGIFVGGINSVIIDSNLIGSVTTANSLHASSTSSTSTSAQRIAGIEYDATGTASIGNNVVANITNEYTGSSTNPVARGIGNTGTGGINTIYNNRVYNITTASPSTGITNNSAMIGVYIFNTTLGGQSVYGNVIHSLRNTSATGDVNILGIFYLGATSGINKIYNNYIHSFNVSSSNAILYGIQANSGNASYYNNMIRFGIDAAGNDIIAPITIYGIYETGTSNNFYFNTVYIGGNGVSNVANNTFALYSSVVSFTRNYKNNLLVNVRSNAIAGGKHYCIRLGGTAPNPPGLSSDYNNFFVNGNGGLLGNYNGSDYSGLAGWNSNTGKDFFSKTVRPYFINATGNSATANLHLQTDANDSFGNLGTPVSGFTSDFDNVLRNDTVPDIGADEFTSNFYVYTYADSHSDSCDFEQLHTDYFNPASQTGTWSVTSGSGIFSDIHDPNATVTGLTVGANVYRWTVTAGTSAGFDEVEVTKWELNGVYTIGVGQDFGSLREACAIYSFACLQGPVTFLLTDNYYSELGVKIWSNIQAGSINTLTIKPATGVNTVVFIEDFEIAGIQLLDADYIIINGSNNETESRNLTLIKSAFEAPFTTTLDAVIKCAGYPSGEGSNHNIFKNLIVKGQYWNSSPNHKVVDFGILIGNTDHGNCSYNRIENCSIDSVSYGIYTQGTDSLRNTGNVFTNNSIFKSSSDSLNNLLYGGIIVSGEDSVEISNNEIGGVFNGISNDVYGISAGLDPLAVSTANTVINASIYNNKISYYSTIGYGAANAGVAMSSGSSGINTIINNSIDINYSPQHNVISSSSGLILSGDSGSVNRAWHNTVRLNIDSTGLEGSSFNIKTYAVNSIDKDPFTDIRNNIFISNPAQGSLTKNYSLAVAYNTDSSSLLCDFNNYYPKVYSNNYSFGAYGSVNFDSLAQWQAATGFDLNSSTDSTLFLNFPHADSLGNCHLNGSGTPLGVVSDIEDELRDTITPDIGADEFDGICTLQLNLKVFIEGFYIGDNTMNAVIDPINYPNLCDTITIELRDALSPFDLAFSSSRTIDIYGNGEFIFPPAVFNKSFYVVVKHRNSLETWSKNPLLFNERIKQFDFSAP